VTAAGWHLVEDAGVGPAFVRGSLTSGSKPHGFNNEVLQQTNEAMHEGARVFAYVRLIGSVGLEEGGGAGWN